MKSAEKKIVIDKSIVESISKLTIDSPVQLAPTYDKEKFKHLFVHLPLRRRIAIQSCKEPRDPFYHLIQQQN